MMEQTITVIGAGLAGSEAAWQLAERGVKVRIYDMKPQKMSPAHKSEHFAELVCSNSFRSDDYEHNAVGLLHEEMRRFGSIVMESAQKNKVPAGGALAVDRNSFAEFISNKLKNHKNIEIINEEITRLPDADDGLCIVATGPLTSESLAEDLLKKIALFILLRIISSQV